jgi:hypothetical protein
VFEHEAARVRGKLLDPAQSLAGKGRCRECDVNVLDPSAVARRRFLLALMLVQQGDLVRISVRYFM